MPNERLPRSAAVPCPNPYAREFAGVPSARTCLHPGRRIRSGSVSMAATANEKSSELINPETCSGVLALQDGSVTSDSRGSNRNSIRDCPN